MCIYVYIHMCVYMYMYMYMYLITQAVAGAGPRAPSESASVPPSVRTLRKREETRVCVPYPDIHKRALPGQGQGHRPWARRARASLWEKVVLPDAVGPAMHTTRRGACACRVLMARASSPALAGHHRVSRERGTG